MMSKELLKKAGILGVTFGLVASPLAFAQEPANPADNISPDEQPVESHSEGTGNPAEYENEDLTTDHGTQGPDTVNEPNSNDMSDDSEYTPDEVVEENSGM
ncbi:hypothetical protein [Halomonas sp. DWK9]|uniref:hypothetical protein n=1 Tax=Halomonas sp. DWK9 TaxID=3060155 RepID=UPI00287F5611|nr:hypothetical protein [Halomonas sp. DWK9]